MKWLTDVQPGSPLKELRGCVATIGVFDGVHLGHRAILDRTLAWARTEARPAVVVTFSVHPDLILHGEAPPLLMTLKHRRRELERCGIEATLVLEFNEGLRQVTAEGFVDTYLVGTLGIRGLVLGHDTTVGRERRGDPKFLDSLGKDRGFEVKVVGEIAVDGTVISSTRIRQAMKLGNLEEAGKLLGRAPSVLGIVEQGEKRGRTLGFPTANLNLASECQPGEGVYAVLVLRGDQRFEGICNIGRRPTFHQDGPSLVEVHLVNFAGDLYGEELEVVFLARLRGEKAFCGPEELRQQIKRDRSQAEEIFRRSRGQP